MKSVKKIDIHAHVTVYPDLVPKLQITGYTNLNCQELIEFYDRLNIEKGVLLPVVAPEGQWVQLTNENSIVATRMHPDRFLWFCNVDPRASMNNPNSDLLYILEHYKALGAKGLGELTSQFYADDPMLDNLFTACEKCDFPVIIHVSPFFGNSYGIVDELGLPRIEKVLQKHPNLKLIGHSQPFWAEMSANLKEYERNSYPTGKVIKGRLWELMSKYENLYCDLSAGSGANALMRDPENAAEFIEAFADRILYGCDFCAITNEHQFTFDKFLDEMVDSGKISEENYRKIVRENAVRLLKLEER